MQRGLAMVALLAVALAGVAHAAPAQTGWRMVGPFGGNARALAYDPSYPDHILLGSGAGAIFESADDGLHWSPLAQLGDGRDLMISGVVFDPSQSSTLYAAGWSITGSGGGFFVSHDRGKSWSEPEGLRDKSIQAIAIASTNPEGQNPAILIAAALDGLYRSQDSGQSWERITPAGDAELKNFESVAIDARDPATLYAGTWHLPWKTTDGGLTWKIIRQGVIDDSDVFSIVVDRGNPQTVFAAACSGIYRSDDGGGLFRKVQGMPYGARRTRALAADPSDPNTLYAGTTEGLWKSIDGGRSFQLITPPDYILNAVLVDPRNPRRLLIATDRGGVFASDDAGRSFYPSNAGFSQRQVSSLVADTAADTGVADIGQSSDLYVSVLNDKEFGEVLYRHQGQWSQLNSGLGQAEVFDLERSPSGELAAATNQGIYRFQPDSRRWEPSRTLLVEGRTADARISAKSRLPKVRLPKAQLSKDRLRRRSRQTAADDRQTAADDRQAASTTPGGREQGGIAIRRTTFTRRVLALALGDRRWYAATSSGVLVSSDRGESWSEAAIGGGDTAGDREFHSVAVQGETAAAATVRRLWYSGDGGEHWWPAPLPAPVTRIYAIAAIGDGDLWIATREGAWHWRRTAPGIGVWEAAGKGLPADEVLSIRASDGWLVAVSGHTAYVSRDGGLSWEPEQTAEFGLSGARLEGGRLYLITRQHGVLESEPGVREPGVTEPGVTEPEAADSAPQSAGAGN